jgi:hypothetical protein
VKQHKPSLPSSLARDARRKEVGIQDVDGCSCDTDSRSPDHPFRGRRNAQAVCKSCGARFRESFAVSPCCPSIRDRAPNQAPPWMS